MARLATHKQPGNAASCLYELVPETIGDYWRLLEVLVS